jgi:hypothetical protein
VRTRADYVVARRVELGMPVGGHSPRRRGDRADTGELENGQGVSPSTLGMVENRLGWARGRAGGYW